MTDRRVVLFLGGGDWADASVEDLEVLADLDLKAARREYNQWDREHPKKWMSFTTWLRVYKGCEPAELEYEGDV